MSYLGISVREALDRINHPNNGWFLPQVQRQYVWGKRHESEDYVCLLLDSILQGYPIGGVVLWETTTSVPHREFLGDYLPSEIAKIVDDGLFGRQKCLVYDGQQRLQTLRSVLRYRYNGRILYFNLLFDRKESQSDDTGFFFKDSNVKPNEFEIKMNTLSCMASNTDQKLELKDSFIDKISKEDLDIKSKRKIIERNFEDLWSAFVEDSKKSIAYYSVKSDSHSAVNEVFRRLNTGGVALTQMELVLSKVKAVQYDYEEVLHAISAEILANSGISFSYASIFQFFHFLAKNTIRIDEDRFHEKDVCGIINITKEMLRSLGESQYSGPLMEVFQHYLRGRFNINNSSIIARWLAIYPILAYLAALFRNNYDWQIIKLTNSNVSCIDKYFVMSQLCDWNTQTMVDSFCQSATIAGEKNDVFPFEIIKQIAEKKNRKVTIGEDQIASLPWFSLKVILRNRVFNFPVNKPQIDHIFPINLKDQNQAYKNGVDIVWNMQPIAHDINNFKRARHPIEFFESEVGEKYISEYDFLPELNSVIWDNPLEFVSYRKDKLLKTFRELYGLDDVSQSVENIGEVNSIFDRV